MIKQFLITCDVDRLENANHDVEYPMIERSIRLALMGRDYLKERGIISIEPFNALPGTREKLGMD